MDAARANRFLYYDDDRNTIYISRDVQRLIDMHPFHLLTWIYAVVDTENGEKLFEMDFAYSGEPIIMRVFLHLDYFMEYHWTAKVVNLDNNTEENK